MLNNVFLLEGYLDVFCQCFVKRIFSDSKPSPTCSVSPLPWKSVEICDGWKDCDDNSDEIGCQCPDDKQFECDCYQSDNGCTEGWGCIKQSEVCNGWKDCDDWSDEVGCQCPSDQFECPCYQSDEGCGWRRTTEGCLDQFLLCDGYNHCGDFSDEKFCLNSELYCINDECVERSKVNDGKVE